MPATTELKLFSNCWHFLFFNILFVPSRAVHFYYFNWSHVVQRQNVAMPSFSGFPFLPRNRPLRNWRKWCCNAQFLGLSISTRFSRYLQQYLHCCNAQFLGLSISTRKQAIRQQETCMLQCPVSRAFHFYTGPRYAEWVAKLCCNAQFLGLSISTVPSENHRKINGSQHHFCK